MNVRCEADSNVLRMCDGNSQGGIQLQVCTTLLINMIYYFSPATARAGFTRYWSGVSPLNHFRLRKLKWAPTVLRQVKEDLRGTQSPQTAIPQNRALYNPALARCCHKKLRCLAKRQTHTLFPQNGPWDLNIALAVSNEMVTYLG